VHAVGGHVVGEAGRAADAGDEDHVLPAHAQLGHEHLHCGEDRVVPAPRAPAHLLVAGPVLLGRGGYGGVGHAGTPWVGPADRWAVMAAASSAPVKGWHWTLLKRWASTRNSARTSRDSWPRFSSGT